MDIFKLGDKILALLEAVFGFWNNQISLVFAMLGQSPVSFKGGGPWAVIEGIEPVFVAVGSSLVVLFFVIGFCSESIDVKDEMRFESILRMLIRLGLAEWFVANNVTIMKAFFTSIGNLVGLISAGTTTQLAIDSTQADIIKGLGFGESLVMLILTALLAIIIIICGFFIIYTVYFRFLKILIIVPLGAIACSTMAGNRMVSHTMATYCKYFLSCVFEAVTMALAILLYKYIGLTGSAYVAIPCVAPIALGGFYSFNGMNFYEYMGKKLHFMFGNRALTYVSTEGEPAIKQLEAEQNEQVKKKGRKAEPETVTADSAVKKQEEFEAMKKKTRNMLLGLVAVIVAAAAGIAAYKAMH